MKRLKRITARGAVAQLVQPLLPPDWVLIEHEGVVADHSRPQVRITTRSIAPSDTGDSRLHLVTVRATITWPGDLIDVEETAETGINDFLYALDDADIPWSNAEKALFGDENKRLGYSVDIEARTSPSTEEE